jgi:hypothetical protein
MNPNPWHRLPPKPPYVLPEDREKIEKFNNRPNQKHPLNLNVIPAPFMGRKDAPVVLLGNIGGVGPHEEEEYKKRPAYADRMRNNLLHTPSPYPFFPLDPGHDTIPSHREWWTPRLECLLQSIRDAGVSNAEQVLAQSILTVELFPYRSSTNEYHGHDAADVVLSKAYSVGLVRDAMKRNAAIVIRYGANRWFRELSDLENYDHLYLLRGVQQTHISATGFVDPSGYNEVIRKILATRRAPPVASRRGRSRG